jgi:pseudouridylate synthase
MIPDALHIAPEVRAALDSGRPVVALESTLITHGLPYPQSVETALAMEAAVREGGAVPATIGILQGRITVGLSSEDIDRLGQAGAVRKCSRRDLAVAVALKEDGSTTVAGTIIVAEMAGLNIFATGGIGGVHRGHPFDVSSDLIELGRTPIAVVCSGAKSILDLQLTLEVLETQGVPVIGWGTDTLPAFYTRSSGLKLTARVETAEQAAGIIHTARQLGLEQGILFTVPAPESEALDEAFAEAAIAQATAEADSQGISGSAVTPFVLGRMVEITGGASQLANTALLVNNARVAGDIAAALSIIQ